jgi:hypothetical protein
MTLEQVSYASQIIASLAVIVSLIYAARQFGIYAKAERETRLVTTVAAVQTFNQMIASDAEIERIWREGLADLGSLSPGDRGRFGALMQCMLGIGQIGYELDDIGGQKHYLDTSAAVLMRQPGAKAWWAHGKAYFPAKLVTQIDALLTKAAPDPGEWPRAAP